MFGEHEAVDQLYIEWDEPSIDDAPISEETFVE